MTKIIKAVVLAAVSMLLMTGLAGVPTTASAAPAPIVVSQGFTPTFTEDGANCGTDPPLQWANPGADSIKAGLTTNGQVSGYLRGAKGQAVLGGDISCLAPVQLAAAAPVINKALKTSSVWKPGVIKLGAHIQRMGYHAATPIFRSTIYVGHPVGGKPPKPGTQTLSAVVSNLTVPYGPRRLVQDSAGPNDKGGTTTQYHYEQDYLDIQIIWPWKCGNLAVNFRKRTVSSPSFTVSTARVNILKTALINNAPVNIGNGTFLFNYCYIQKDPITGAMQPQVCAPQPNGNVSTDPLGAIIGALYPGSTVTVTEIPSNGWIPTNSAGQLASYSQTGTVTDTGLTFNFYNIRSVSGCACVNQTTVATSTVAQAIVVTVCGFDIPVTPDMVHVTYDGVPQLVSAAGSNGGIYTFNSSYVPGAPGAHVIKVWVSDTRNVTVNYPDIPITVYQPT